VGALDGRPDFRLKLAPAAPITPLAKGNRELPGTKQHVHQGG
jgi:hypothetical protein